MAVTRISPWCVISPAAERPLAFSPGDGLWVGTRWIETDGAIWEIRQDGAGVRSWVCLGGAAFSTGGGLLVVDGSSSSSGEELGTWEAPFRTIGAALAVLQDVGTVLVMPGTYAESLVWPDRAGTALVGFSAGNTSVVAPAGQPALRFACGAGSTAFTFAVRHLTLQASGGGPALMLEGQAQATGAFLAVGAEIEDCRVSSGAGVLALWCRRCGRVRLERCEVVGLTDVRNCSTWSALECSFDRVHMEYLSQLNPPSTGRGVYELANCSLSQSSDLDLAGHPNVRVDNASVILGSTLDGGNFTNNPALGLAPRVALAGTHGHPGIPGSGQVIFTLPADVPTAGNFVTLEGARIWGVTDIGGALGVGRNMVLAHGAAFNMLPSAGTVRVGPETDFDVRRAYYQPDQLTIVGTGFFVREEVQVPPGFFLAAIPASYQYPGASVLVLNGRKAGEGVGAGTGVLGVYSGAGPAGAGWYLADGSGLVAI